MRGCVHLSLSRWRGVCAVVYVLSMNCGWDAVHMCYECACTFACMSGHDLACLGSPGLHSLWMCRAAIETNERSGWCSASVCPGLKRQGQPTLLESLRTDCLACACSTALRTMPSVAAAASQAINAQGLAPRPLHIRLSQFTCIPHLHTWPAVTQEMGSIFM